MKKRYDKERIIQEVAALAFSKATDVAALAFLPPGSDISGMDVSMAAEVKVGEKGSNQVKLVDRVELIRLLVELIGAEGSETAQAQSFFQALNAAAQETEGDKSAI